MGLNEKVQNILVELAKEYFLGRKHSKIHGS